MPTRIAVCQTPDIRQDIPGSIDWIKKFAREADGRGASLLCFPECFLQGYLTEPKLANKYALDLNSAAFQDILIQISQCEPALVFGMIEKKNDDLYNTAVVVKKGKIIAVYRKVNLLPGERLFKAGNTFPVFELGQLVLGINICYDTQFPSASREIAQNGASIMLCPSNNMMRLETAGKLKALHHKIRQQRAVENRLWIFSSDVTGSRDGRVSYGPSSVINPAGKIVAQVPLMETGMVAVDV